MKTARSIRKFVFLLIVSFVIPSTLAVYAAEKSIRVKPVGPTGEGYALLIGIADYQDPNIPDLEYTKNDVILLGSTLIGHLGFSSDRVIPLLDRAATKQAIENEINRIAEYAEADDLVLIYFSGHGSYGSDLDGDETDGTDEYILPWDTIYGKLYTAIPDDLFGYWIRRIRSQKILLAFDSCYSGGAAKGTRSFQMMKGTTKAQPQDSVVSDVSRDGVAVLTASKADQLAQESEHLDHGHGVFTYFLCKALAGGADLNHDSVISISELYEGVYEEIKNWTFKENKPLQTPTMANRIGSRFQLAYRTPPAVTVKYVAPGKRKILVQRARKERVLVSEGHYKTVKTRGYWKSEMAGISKTWIPGEEKKVWVEPVYKLVEVPVQYKEVEEGRGRFVLVR
jgi:uncharacterized caspase-like protein